MTQITTISEFLLQAGTEYRIFDMGRGIVSLPEQTFLELEQGLRPAPRPRQQHAWFGVLFWNKQLSHQHYIWFIKLPLDERGLLQLAARQQFLQTVVDALGQQLEQAEKHHGQLPENPYCFIPNQQQLANFNAISRRTLGLQASEHINLAVTYLSAPALQDWRQISLQGIAELAIYCLDEPTCMMDQFGLLASEVQDALLNAWENHLLPVPIADYLMAWYRQQPFSLQREQQILRAFSQTAHTEMISLISQILTREDINQDTLILLAARHWLQFASPDNAQRLLEAISKVSPELFPPLFADLVQIPTTRSAMLSVLRSPDKSPALTQAIGGLFGQTS